MTLLDAWIIGLVPSVLIILYWNTYELRGWNIPYVIIGAFIAGGLWPIFWPWHLIMTAKQDQES
ncbi:hypothetical protein HOU02_gp386 [Caulobacter phage CcrBL9]|uniref:Uncharacterized protein n=1 Tax=Caulobacter phage CcrBL9 TaxID=2283270 RepID=A0A385EF79_9CAUD|nr:hypothetical protein HOU02_gp386 [Caulobacter phage CcrBL9]AXQ69339.1 hypothetical protein CcrBL9_gp315 [Caulobacter phage CcrBL9]